MLFPSVLWSSALQAPGQSSIGIMTCKVHQTPISPLPEGALRLPPSTRAPRAVALLGCGRVDTLRLVERFTRRATTG